MDPTLLTLPDDVLLCVMAYLPPRQLFVCRVLCRRLRDLCLHADLWRSVRVHSRNLCIRRAAIRLAPCLRELDLRFTTEDLEALACDLTRSTCVVARLGLPLCDNIGVAWAAVSAARISALGGLLELSLIMRGPAGLNVNPLLMVLCNVGQLRKLKIDLFIEPIAPLCDLAWSSSLIELTYESCTQEDPLLQWLLQEHAATLEQVHVETQTTLPVSSLKKLDRLRSFTCRPDDEEDLSELLTCPNLETFEITWDFIAYCPPWIDFLRGASQLRCVSFPCPAEDPTALLLALATSPCAPVVETLCLQRHHENGEEFTTDTDMLDASVVADVLPRFPSLQTLALWTNLECDSLLRAVTPTSSPRLTVLKMVSPGGLCTHAWLHDSAQDVLKRNRRLHLLLWCSRFCPDLPEQCEWCRTGCHPELREYRGFKGKLAFAAHTRTANCPRNCVRWSC